MTKSPPAIKLEDQDQFRIIPSTFPTINFFEDLVNASEMELLWEIESLTNERLRQEVGDIFLVPPEERVSGPNSSIIMAAFTHIGKESRFTDGSYGIYYASLSIETAIKETVHHREQFLQRTSEEACEITMRLYQGNVIEPLHDVRGNKFSKLYHPSNYKESQVFAKKLRESKSWGLVYNSVRHIGGECIAVFKPKAISIPKQISHLRYVWNGKKSLKYLIQN